MSISFTPAELQAIAWHTFDIVVNKRKPLKVDRKMMPWLSYLNQHESTTGLAGPIGPIVQYKTQAGVSLQGWERRDNLLFSEQSYEMQTQFPWANIHTGLELVHDTLEANGFNILPNQPRGKSVAKSDSASEAARLQDYVEEQIEARMDAFDVAFDQTMLRDNSATPKLPQGLDAYLPTGVPTIGVVSDGDGTRGYYGTGSLGGKSRAAYPDVLCHFLWLAATYGANGSLRNALITAKHEAELRSRGRSKTGIKYIMAGWGAIERMIKFATANNTNYVIAPTAMQNGGLSSLDIGIPEAKIAFEGIPVIHNPTFEVLDTIESATYPWTRRMYLMADDAMTVSYAPGKKKYFSAPPDEADLRVSRFSLDSKLCLRPEVPNACAIVTLAS